MEGIWKALEGLKVSLTVLFEQKPYWGRLVEPQR